jgi:RHS repeat-associated protein
MQTDERGSIVSVSDDSANVLSINSYDEYGIPGSGNTCRFQYTGQMWLGEVGLYYYKNRFYSPTLGRFMQADPIGYHVTQRGNRRQQTFFEDGDYALYADYGDRITVTVY